MYLGIDFGTSGCRACIINDSDDVIFETSLTLPSPINNSNKIEQDPSLWWQALLQLLGKISHQFNIKSVSDICVNGTSATVVHCSQEGEPLSNALMYNDLSSINFISSIKSLAPAHHVTLSPSSALSKMMLLQDKNKEMNGKMLNQADWLSNRLCGEFAFSDYNNALKMGYDASLEKWPTWVTQLIAENTLPKVLAPGTIIGHLTQNLCDQFGFTQGVNIKLGTTDSIAAFLATGIKNSSQAVTSLGSTLVLKLLTDVNIENSQYGLYSHKLGRFWLAGGASNSGGSVLSQYFTSQQLEQLSLKIDPNLSSKLNYYPLPSIGERFPINDAYKIPILTPKPQQDEQFLKGLFEGIANIEHLGYQKLVELGATKPEQVITCGGGAKNTTWQAIRQRILGIEVRPATHSQACYGSALLAKYGLNEYL